MRTGALTLLGLIGVRAQRTGLLFDDVDGDSVRGVSCKECRPRLLLEERLERAERLRRPSTMRAEVALGVNRIDMPEELEGLEPLLDEKLMRGPLRTHPHGQAPSGTLSRTLS